MFYSLNFKTHINTQQDLYHRQPNNYWRNMQTYLMFTMDDTFFKEAFSISWIHFNVTSSKCFHSKTVYILLPHTEVFDQTDHHPP